MSREIKFRVWDKVFNNFEDSDKSWEDVDEFYLTPRKLLEASIRNLEPERYIIQQFTGLKDKNDREIYEGDILRGDYSRKYYIGRNIKNGEDCGAKFSENKEDFYSDYQVLWFNGAYEVNCSEYSILINGWAVKRLFDNLYIKEKTKPYGIGEIKPLGLPFESENYGAYGLVANSCAVVGNIFENQELLKNV